MSKQYGLIKPGKSNVSAPVLQRPSIFDEDSDSDNDVKKPTGITKNVKRQDKILHQKALAEDPTVFQYDELYDDIQTKRNESKLMRKDLDKKPKYINKLLVAAERRKRENERRIERQVQKEREEEGNQFKDKEEFVTSSYRKKLEELKELEEAEKREEYLEAIGDVKKQGDLSGFYRHLYDQKVNYEDEKEKEDNVVVKTETRSRSTSPEEKEIVEKEPEEKEIAEKEPEEKKKGVKRKYRRRDDSDSEEEKKENEEEKKLVHLPSNIDADSDFSIDSDDSDEEDSSKKSKKIKEEEGEFKKPDDVKTEDNKENKEDKPEENINNGTEKADKSAEEEKEKKVEKKEVEKKPKIDIWKKRTVGVIFDEAVQRYYQRKAIREGC